MLNPIKPLILYVQNLHIWFIQVLTLKLESRRTPVPIVNRTGDCYVIQSIKAIRLERLAHDHLSNPTTVRNA